MLDSLSYPPGCGTVFRVTTSGKERMLYSFGGSPDGNYPNTTLFYMKGVLYGTTLLGGSGSCTRTAGQWLWHRLLIVGVLITVVTSWRVGEINSRRTRSRHRRSVAFPLTR